MQEQTVPDFTADAEAAQKAPPRQRRKGPSKKKYLNVGKVTIGLDGEFEHCRPGEYCRLDDKQAKVLGKKVVAVA